MAAGLGKSLAGDDHARPLDEAEFEGVFEADVGAAEIADRGEAAMEHLLHDAGGVQRDQRVRKLGIVGRVGVRRVDVDVAVDQPGHQKSCREGRCGGRRRP